MQQIAGGCPAGMARTIEEAAKPEEEGKTAPATGSDFQAGLLLVQGWKALAAGQRPALTDPPVRQEAMTIGPDGASVPASDSQAESRSWSRATGQGWPPSPGAAKETSQKEEFHPLRRAKCRAALVPQPVGCRHDQAFVPKRRRHSAPADPPRLGPRGPTVSATASALGLLLGLETLAPSNSAPCVPARYALPAYRNCPSITVWTSPPIAIPAISRPYASIGAAVVSAPTGLRGGGSPRSSALRHDCHICVRFPILTATKRAVGHHPERTKGIEQQRDRPRKVKRFPFQERKGRERSARFGGGARAASPEGECQSWNQVEERFRKKRKRVTDRAFLLHADDFVFLGKFSVKNGGLAGWKDGR